MAANRDKIFQLEEKLAKSGKNNTSLRATIERMKAELEVKDQMILALKDDLSKKDIRIEELNVAVTDLNSNVQELTAVNEAQEAKIEEQIKNINEVWYCIGNDKDLKDADILTGTGLFRSKKIFEKDFDKKIFVEADLRELKSIPIDAKKAKLLSKHPEGSFQIGRASCRERVLRLV